MKSLLALLVLFCGLQEAQAKPGKVRHFLYNGPYFKLNISVEDPYTTAGLPRVTAFSVNYAPSLLGQVIGREKTNLKIENITAVDYIGWSPKTVAYVGWSGMGGNSGHTQLETDPFPTIQITTTSPLLNRISIVFSRNYAEQMPSLSVNTDRAAFLLHNPLLKEVATCEAEAR